MCINGHNDPCDELYDMNFLCNLVTCQCFPISQGPYISVYISRLFLVQTLYIYSDANLLL